MTDRPAAPADWIGHEIMREDVLSERLVAQLRATLAGTLGPDAVPAGAFWMLAPDVVDPDQFGRDGHPRPGLFLPKMPLPIRMWAGGEITQAGPLSIGDRVTRRSTVTDVQFKTGRSGRLGFVSISHEYAVKGDARVIERQDIVYRAENTGARRPPDPAPDWNTPHRWHITPTPTLLFRFSALTFNGHRIHYDHPYATEVEGYAGLVVHGPLQAVWMQNLAAMVFGHQPSRFSYRGLSPLIVGEAVSIEAQPGAEGRLDLRVRREADGVVTMSARAWS